VPVKRYSRQNPDKP